MQRVLFNDLEGAEHRVHMHVTRLAEMQSSTPHTHDFYELFLVTDGGGIHHLNRKAIALRSGDLVAIRPQDVHWFTAGPPAGLAFVNVAVSAAWWAAWRTLFGLPTWDATHRDAKLSNAETRDLGRALRRLTLTDDPIEAMRVWKRVGEHLAGRSTPSAPSPPAWLETLRQEMASTPESLDEPIAYWQRRSERSPEHLARSCRKFYGMSFRDVLGRARIERAKYLLRTTDRKVITIGFECGFHNMANFYRSFARWSGMTPNGWRLAGSAAVPQDDAAASPERVNRRSASAGPKS